LWNKTSFLAEKVLGNVVSAGIKVLVLAVIVGIGSGLLAEFQVQPNEPSIDHALVVMLVSLSLLALGIFGPGIATGLVSGAPQLGAGAMAGAATSMASGAKSAFKAGSTAAGGGAKGAIAGLGNVAKTGAQTVGQKAAGALRSGSAGAASGADSQQQPVWAKRLQSRQKLSHAAMTAAHALRGGDGGGSGQGPSLNDSDT